MGGHDGKEAVSFLNITVHWWGDKYGPEYVRRLVAGVRRNLREPHRMVVIHDKPEPDLPADVDAIPMLDTGLTQVKGCFARLRLFSPAWQAWVGILTGDRIVSMDLDAIVVGGLDTVFDRPEGFVILRGVNTSNPCPMNGSLWMLRAGHRPDVWSSFSLEKASKVPFHEFPDDQAWFNAMMPDAAGWTSKDGVYAFAKREWPRGSGLPANARYVAFPGSRDPSQFVNIPWVVDHWIGDGP
jgi:hypothetical protein